MYQPSIRFILITNSKVLSLQQEDKVISAPNHLDWLTFFRLSANDYKHPRVLIYINVQLTYIYISLRKDIFNYKNISYFSFFNNSDIFFMINIYSDNHQVALKYIKDIEVNLYNILVIAKNFNIRNIILLIYSTQLIVTLS